MVGSEMLEIRVDDIVQVKINPQKTWAKWMGTEMADIHDDLWSDFLKDSFRLLIRYAEPSSSLQQQQAPGPRTQAPVPIYPER